MYESNSAAHDSSAAGDTTWWPTETLDPLPNELPLNSFGIPTSTAEMMGIDPCPSSSSQQTSASTLSLDELKHEDTPHGASLCEPTDWSFLYQTPNDTQTVLGLEPDSSPRSAAPEPTSSHSEKGRAVDVEISLDSPITESLSSMRVEDLETDERGNRVFTSAFIKSLPASTAKGALGLDEDLPQETKRQLTEQIDTRLAPGGKNANLHVSQFTRGRPPPKGHPSTIDTVTLSKDILADEHLLKDAPVGLTTQILHPQFGLVEVEQIKGVYKNCRHIYAAQWTDDYGQRHTKYFNPKNYLSEEAARIAALRFKIAVNTALDKPPGKEIQRHAKPKPASDYLKSQVIRSYQQQQLRQQQQQQQLQQQQQQQQQHSEFRDISPHSPLPAYDPQRSPSNSYCSHPIYEAMTFPEYGPSRSSKGHYASWSNRFDDSPYAAPYTRPSCHSSGHGPHSPSSGSHAESPSSNSSAQAPTSSHPASDYYLPDHEAMMNEFAALPQNPSSNASMLHDPNQKYLDEISGLSMVV